MTTDLTSNSFEEMTQKCSENNKIPAQFQSQASVQQFMKKLRDVKNSSVENKTIMIGLQASVEPAPWEWELQGRLNFQINILFCKIRFVLENKKVFMKVLFL